ncbi:MAG: hypothetical protein CMN56_00320 [Sneathiella sp.]|uniref:hypothetical protein n=1 Tax=Sneathiella sp. TaxID=1964365 RepID=UPI000C5A53E3|nr:hypothetical protein [Sneathiella sp.]MAZ01564.1 hypothetical protein [Sneathiella sp.]
MIIGVVIDRLLRNRMPAMGGCNVQAIHISRGDIILRVDRGVADIHVILLPLIVKAAVLPFDRFGGGKLDQLVIGCLEARAVVPAFGRRDRSVLGRCGGGNSEQ